MQCLALGCAHTAVVRNSDGALFTRGTNSQGQLGHGDRHDRDALTRVEGPLLGKRVVGVSAGYGHTAAFTAAGELFTWGEGSDGRLGHGDEVEGLVPTQVQSMRGKRVVAVSCGTGQTAAVTDDGELHVCGYGRFSGQRPYRRDQYAYTPKRVGGALLGKRVVAVSVGCSHTAVLTDEGCVYTFGSGYGGKLGHGDVFDREVPTLVGGALQGKFAVGISAGEDSTAVVMEGGELYTFGKGDTTGQETLGATLPTLVEALQGKRVVSVSSTSSHAVAVTADGECYTWGKGDDGQLGHGNEIIHTFPKLVNALVGECVVAAAGHSHTAALTAEGDLFTWGVGRRQWPMDGTPVRLPRIGRIPWYTSAPAALVARAEATTTVEERLSNAYAALSTLLRDTNPAALDDAALAEFDGRITQAHDVCVRFLNDALTPKRAIVQSELTRRECAEAVAEAIPDAVCPISYSLMRDPVLAADGISYERREVEKWFSDGNVRSPLTGADMPSTTLFPNITLRKLIEHAQEAKMKAAAAAEAVTNGGGDGGRGR